MDKGSEFAAEIRDALRNEYGFVSAGQLCDLQTRPEHVASRMAIYGFSTISDDATALR